MSRPAYKAYVNKAFRFYFRNPHYIEQPDVDKASASYLNWTACDEIVSGLSRDDHDALAYVYITEADMPEAVRTVAREYRKSGENEVWALLNRVTRKFAESRKLV